MPKLLYEITEREFIARADTGLSVVLQQADPLGRMRPDALIFVSRPEAERLCEVLAQWLADTEEGASK